MLLIWFWFIDLVLVFCSEVAVCLFPLLEAIKAGGVPGRNNVLWIAPLSTKIEVGIVCTDDVLGHFHLSALGMV